MNYNIYSILFAVFGGLLAGLFFGYNMGLIMSILFYIYSIYSLKIYKNENKELLINFKFTRD